MHRSLSIAIAAGALLFAVAVPCAAQSRVAFVRGVFNTDFTLRSSTLYRVNIDGTGFLQLAPMTAGTYRFDPRWSPSGNTLVYTFRSGGGAGQLWRMTATGGNRTRLTFGTADHHGPAWRGDGGMIAYIAQGASGACLAIVRPDATGQRNIFCPPGPAYIDTRPMWSSDGTRLFISTSFRGSGLEPPYFSRAYSVNASTGAATLLTAQTFDDFRYLVFHPSGTNGLYAGDGSIDAVNFATDVLVPRAQGEYPLWSQGGSRFAYTKRQFSDSGPLIVYDHVWVMSADGSTDVEVTPPIVDNIEYVAVEFSRDATRLLTDRTVYMPSEPGSGLYVGDPYMRLFNVASGTWVNLPQGGASDWFQP
ncbi:hypothetical protein LK996_06170 [Lysobacter sp. A6]|uniref:Translocation protein TolB n=1 Tax=Noviluteimonas lactosilytica TaxID=2888523 RepID=A0ABS8JGC8_9GAMM|nr:hypothetical protein [Lysobacter lactosilyticus]MCC8362658.1 hypothetical protein [Lysobacter lactosilyticus]